MSVFKMLSEMTQLERIEWHLNKFGSIDDDQARKLYGDRRLSDKILKLRRMNYNIESKRIPCKNRYGDKTEYVRYILKKTDTSIPVSN